MTAAPPAAPPLTWRYPDKPLTTLSRAALGGLSQKYAAQVKADGWRTLVEVTDTGPFIYTSRERLPIPITDACRVPFEADIRGPLALLPPGTLLDAEWCARRPAARSEMLWMFDILRLGDRDLYGMAFVDRYLLLIQALGDEIGHKYVLPTNLHCSGPGVLADYGAMFDHWHTLTDSRCAWATWGEGIVLKDRSSPYIGSSRDCALNPGWIRCKWRAGEDGRTEL